MTSVLDDLASEMAQVERFERQEQIEARREVISSLASSDRADALLALAADRASDSETRLLEDVVVSVDATYVRGSHQLLRVMAGLALEIRLENSSLSTAISVLSEGFLGGELIRPTLYAAAQRVEIAHSVRSRGRVGPRLQAPLLKRLATQTPDPSSSEFPQAINALSRRLEEAIQGFDDRLKLADEEIDVLWWARTIERKLEGEPGSDEATKAIRTTAEVARLIRLPASAATLEVLESLNISEADQRVSVGSLAEAAVEADLPSVDPARALPILSARATFSSFPESREAAEQLLLKAAGVPLDHSVDLAMVPRQLLRELALAQATEHGGSES